MFTDIEILTKNERLNSRQESQRKKFKIAGQTILNGDHISTYDYSKRQTNECNNIQVNFKRKREIIKTSL